MLKFVNSFESADSILNFFKQLKRDQLLLERIETLAEPTKMAKEIFKENIRGIMRKEPQRIKYQLPTKTGITEEDRLAAAIQAAKRSIKEENGMKIGDGK